MKTFCCLRQTIRQHPSPFYIKKTTELVVNRVMVQQPKNSFVFAGGIGKSVFLFSTNCYRRHFCIVGWPFPTSRINTLLNIKSCLAFPKLSADFNSWNPLASYVHCWETWVLEPTHLLHTQKTLKLGKTVLEPSDIKILIIWRLPNMLIQLPPGNLLSEGAKPKYDNLVVGLTHSPNLLHNVPLCWHIHLGAMPHVCFKSKL